VYLAFVEELATQQGFPAVKAPSFFLVMGPVSHCTLHKQTPVKISATYACH
jgi:hypothetical protein